MSKDITTKRGNRLTWQWNAGADGPVGRVTENGWVMLNKAHPRVAPSVAAVNITALMRIADAVERQHATEAA